MANQEDDRPPLWWREKRGPPCPVGGPSRQEEGVGGESSEGGQLGGPFGDEEEKVASIHPDFGEDGGQERERGIRPQWLAPPPIQGECVVVSGPETRQLTVVQGCKSVKPRWVIWGEGGNGFREEAGVKHEVLPTP